MISSDSQNNYSYYLNKTYDSKQWQCRASSNKGGLTFSKKNKKTKQNKQKKTYDSKKKT